MEKFTYNRIIDTYGEKVGLIYERLVSDYIEGLNPTNTVRELAQEINHEGTTISVCLQASQHAVQEMKESSNHSTTKRVKTFGLWPQGKTEEMLYSLGSDLKEGTVRLTRKSKKDNNNCDFQDVFIISRMGDEICISDIEAFKALYEVIGRVINVRTLP